MERKIFGALAASDADIETLCAIRDELLVEWQTGGPSCPEPLAARILIDLAESALDRFERICHAMEDGTMELDVQRLGENKALLDPAAQTWDSYPQVSEVYPSLARAFQTYVIMQTAVLVDRDSVDASEQSLAAMEKCSGTEQLCTSIRETIEAGKRATQDATGYAETFSRCLEEQIVALWDIAGDVTL